jgi:hypothetical protein
MCLLVKPAPIGIAISESAEDEAYSTSQNACKAEPGGAAGVGPDRALIVVVSNGFERVGERDYAQSWLVRFA